MDNTIDKKRFYTDLHRYLLQLATQTNTLDDFKVKKELNKLYELADKAD